MKQKKHNLKNLNVRLEILQTARKQSLIKQKKMKQRKRLNARKKLKMLIIIL